MPFTKGHRLSVGNKGGGRKGYEFESSEMRRMHSLFNSYLTLVEKLTNKSLSKKEEVRLKLLERSALKIMDKLHSNKLAIKDETEKPILII